MAAFPDDVMAEYKRCFRRPEVIAATCADYRAGATIDDSHDLADLKQGRMIECPTLALYSGVFVDDQHDPLKQVAALGEEGHRPSASSQGISFPRKSPTRSSARLQPFLLICSEAQVGANAP